MIRRFTRKVQASGKPIIAKKKQYFKKSKSRRLRRRAANENRVKREKFDLLRKTGRLEERGSRRRRR